MAAEIAAKGRRSSLRVVHDTLDERGGARGEMTQLEGAFAVLRAEILRELEMTTGPGCPDGLGPPPTCRRFACTGLPAGLRPGCTQPPLFDRLHRHLQRHTYRCVEARASPTGGNRFRRRRCGLSRSKSSARSGSRGFSAPRRAYAPGVATARLHGAPAQPARCG